MPRIRLLTGVCLAFSLCAQDSIEALLKKPLLDPMQPMVEPEAEVRQGAGPI